MGNVDEILVSDGYEKLEVPQESVDGSSSPKPKAVTLAPWRFWLFGIPLYISIFLSMMDASIVASTLHTISIEFKVFLSVNWVALAYTLAECSCAVVFARVSDVIGRRTAFAIANVLFFAASIACGFARSLNELIAFRAVQGLGGAGLYSLSMVIFPEVCPDHLLVPMAALCGLSIVVAAIVGPILGGVLTQYATWRWVFWMNAPICVFSMVLFIAFWPKADFIISVPRRSWKMFDYGGAILQISGAVLVVFAFQNVGVSAADVFGRAIFIAPLAIGVACWIALFVWEYMVERKEGLKDMPTFPLALFRNRHYASSVLITLLMGFPLILLIFSVPLRAQLVSGKTPLDASAVLLPFLGAAGGGTVLAAVFSCKKNFLFETMVAGAVLSTVGCGLLTTISSAELDKRLLGYLVLPGLGIGIATSAATILTGVEIAPRNYAPAQGIMAQVRLLGGSLGISTSTVFLHNEITKLFPGKLSPQFLSMLDDVEANLSVQMRKVVAQACSRAFQHCMIVSTAISGVALVLVFIGYQAVHPDILRQRLNLARSEGQKALA
ncbi:Efflux pump FUS6-like protein [Cladobotryum mycophilum]|uniref:Efflux pump FUS6-like protein n=1 Tax=Cladobotryum mycophilum TaxID=491253 RepID=A0ABR0SQJ3_9HYPO